MKLTHKQKLLNLLKDGNWHNFRELNEICFRYGARLWDLKMQDGIDHEIKKVNGIEYYRLKQKEEIDAEIEEEKYKAEAEEEGCAKWEWEQEKTREEEAQREYEANQYQPILDY